MDITIHPRKLHGTVPAIPSKSHAHRLLICAALSDGPVDLICPVINEDICATVTCLNALGAQIQQTNTGYRIIPIGVPPKKAQLHCKESGSTLRFLLPVVGALGIDATFLLEGRLPERPLSPLWEELEKHGVNLTKPTKNTIRSQGKLQSDEYSIDGSVSSQYITGLLFALAIIGNGSHLTITGSVESQPYISLTEQVMRHFQIDTGNLSFHDCYPFRAVNSIICERDWSNAAFFVGSNALGNHVSVCGLSDNSPQGDRAITILTEQLKKHTDIDGRDIPDLIPILSVIAAANQGAAFHHIGRLRFKESDRVAAVAQMLEQLGAEVRINGDSMYVFPAGFHSCIIDSKNDHRIAMAAAIASTCASGPVTITDAECVKKSYPGFWEDFKKLGGCYEQYIR